LPVVARLKWAVRILVLVCAVALLWGTRACTRWPQVYFMTGGSMEPAVRAREYFVATGPVPHPRRGTLVIFRYEDADGVFHVLRRVAGLPGDTVAMRDGRAVVNGRDAGWPFRILESGAWRSAFARGGNLFTWGPIVVPADSVFLLADTRDMIGWPDSRFLGPIPLADVEAQATRIIWPRILRKVQ
jgi:signal peptidase I